MDTDTYEFHFVAENITREQAEIIHDKFFDESPIAMVVSEEPELELVSLDFYGMNRQEASDGEEDEVDS